MYDDDVSVRRITDSDGWDDRVPPSPRSRVRVLAVMGAVVVGCGVAAFVVKTLPDEERRVSEPDEVSIITFPDRTAGSGAPEAPVSLPTPTTRSGTSSTAGGPTTTTTPPTSSSSPGSTTAGPTIVPTADDPPTEPGPAWPTTPPPEHTTTTTTRTPPDDDHDDDHDEDDEDDDCSFIFCW